jgi:hypothetical protein
MSEAFWMRFIAGKFHLSQSYPGFELIRPRSKAAFRFITSRKNNKHDGYNPKGECECAVKQIK